MQDFEKLGVFYLGRLYDMKAEGQREGLLLYDSNDLVTHLETINLMPTKTNISVQITSLTWIPNWQDAQAKITPAWK